VILALGRVQLLQIVLQDFGRGLDNA